MNERIEKTQTGGLSSLGCWVYVVGLICFAVNVNLGISFFCAAIALMTVDDRFKGENPQPRTFRERLGVAFYLLSFIIWFSTSCSGYVPAGVFFLIGLMFAGSGPLRTAAFQLKEWLVSFGGDRWIDVFGGFFLAVGVIIMAVSVVTGAGIWVDFRSISIGVPGNKLSGLPASALMFCFGLFIFSLGYGIRQRALWAGALGLGMTFWSFMRAVTEAFSNTQGNLTLLPRELIHNSFSILLHWFFFFAFYSTFFPLVSKRARELAASLEKKLQIADEQLHDTKQRLSEAQEQATATSKSLEEERIKLQAAFETINEGIVIFDSEDRILYANPAYCSLYEIRREDWVGKSWRPIFERPGFECINLGMLAMQSVNRFHDSGVEKPAAGEIIIRDEKGNLRRRTSFYAKKITSACGEILAFIGFSRDVTLEREIDRMKTEFVSNVSHELRTPLTSIRAYAEMLIDGEAENPETSRDYLKIILDEAERLTLLINDILDLSKMEAGKKIYRYGSHDPAGIMKKVNAVCSSASEKKGIKLELIIPSEPRTVFCDPDLIHQATMNLLNNAIKYTPEKGRISLKMSFSSDRYNIEVSDNGPGISLEDQKKLFEKFFRVENSLNREIGGTGLGLALVKHIVQVHQGTVGVISEPGRGATFTMSLPVIFTPAA